MIKGISQINGLAKKTLLAAIFAGSVGFAATNNPIKSIDKNPTQNQTEVISKKGADALRSNIITQTPAVPTVHNTQLDNTLRKFIECDEDKEYIEGIIGSIYKDNGTFLGSALVQHEIDIQQLYALVSGNTKVQINNNINPELARKIEGFGAPFFKTLTPNKDKVTDTAINDYTPKLFELLKFDHKPTEKEVMDRLDKIASEKISMKRDDFIEYLLGCDTFDYHENHEKKDTKSMANMIAYKMHYIDEFALKILLYNNGVFGNGAFEKGKESLAGYYDKWMESVAPKGE